MPGKAKGRSLAQRQGKQSVLGWRPPPPSSPGAPGGRDSPGVCVLPAAAAPTRPPPQLRAPRCAPPVAAREWSGPSVATTLFDSDSCSSCWGSRARARAVAAAGGWRAEGSTEPPAQAVARGGRPRETRTRGSRRGTACSEDPGWAFLTLVSTCCPAPPRPPFTSHALEVSAPQPGQSLFCGHWPPREQPRRGAAAAGCNDSAPFVPQRLGQNGGGRGRGQWCALTSISRLQSTWAAGRWG